MVQPLEHLLDIESQDTVRIRSLLERAAVIRAKPRRYRDAGAGRLLVNLFYEPSTRTRFSFEIAALRLGMQVVNFAAAGSSVSKGETLLDSFKTLEAMGAGIIVVRHPDNGAVAGLAAAAGAHTRVINAGDGSHAHPSQALLDAFTLQQHFEDLSAIRILIAGDLRHSRVTRSDLAIFRKLGVGEVRLAAPPQLQPDQRTSAGAAIHERLEDALDGVNAVMMLRIQRERQAQSALPDAVAYHREWGLTAERLALAAPDCIVMHPGPMNRGVEIASEVADGPQSVILEQVRNGVWMRMAILEAMLA